MNEDIRIYVADLAAYNNGNLHGVFINVCDDMELSGDVFTITASHDVMHVFWSL